MSAGLFAPVMTEVVDPWVIDRIESAGGDASGVRMSQQWQRDSFTSYVDLFGGFVGYHAPEEWWQATPDQWGAGWSDWADDPGGAAGKSVFNIATLVLPVKGGGALLDGLNGARVGAEGAERVAAGLGDDAARAGAADRLAGAGTDLSGAGLRLGDLAADAKRFAGAGDDLAASLHASPLHDAGAFADDLKTGNHLAEPPAQQPHVVEPAPHAGDPAPAPHAPEPAPHAPEPAPQPHAADGAPAPTAADAAPQPHPGDPASASPSVSGAPAPEAQPPVHNPPPLGPAEIDHAAPGGDLAPANYDRFGGESPSQFVEKYWDADHLNEWDGSRGAWHYPPQDGFDTAPGVPAPRAVELPAGYRFDRFGGPAGDFVAPEGTGFAERALPPDSLAKPYHVYELMKPFDADSGAPLAGRAAAWFEQTGGGIQFKLPRSVEWLIDHGYLREVVP